PDDEISQAVKLATSMGSTITVIKTNELYNEKYVLNDTNRCYHCKSELFDILTTMAKNNSLDYVADGSNSDDENDYRPGIKAATQFNVRSPLKEAGLTKKEIRTLSKNKGLSTWNKPSVACLASRIPYGNQITVEKLSRIGAAERFIKKMGFDQVRVRDEGATARVEIEKTNFTDFMAKNIDSLSSKLKELGYIYVSLDLDGYRTGSMNEVLQENNK
ncbi:MAG: ATP-dependent sacrificial sulfur transferase LarE, partial [Actinobacteria bacterium]